MKAPNRYRIVFPWLWWVAFVLERQRGATVLRAYREAQKITRTLKD